jgi:hypothetical protein
MVRFDCSTTEREIILQIAQRAIGMGLVKPSDDDALRSAQMDIAAVHCNGTPLRLNAFCWADNFNFVHDFRGIERHLNRATGRLENQFLPRFARPATQRTAH